METLPPEVTLHILGFLPAQDAVLMKRLSNSFKEIIEKGPKRIQQIKMVLKIARTIGADCYPRNALFVTINGQNMTLYYYNDGMVAIRNGVGAELFVKLTKSDESTFPLESFLNNLLAVAEIERLILESNWLVKLVSIPILKKIISVATTVEVTGSFMEFGFLALRGEQQKEKPTLFINGAKFVSMLVPMIPGILANGYKEVQLAVRGRPEQYIVPLLNRCHEKVELPLRLKLTVSGATSPPSTVQTRQAAAPQLGLQAFANLQSISQLPDVFKVVTSDQTKITTVTIDRQPGDTVIMFESKPFQ